jgi:transposase InsO family protein
MNLNDWHIRFGHPAPQTLLLGIRKQAFSDLTQEELLNQSTPLCDPCQRGKALRKPIPKSTPNKSTAPLQKIHVDLTGKNNTPSMAGTQYAMFNTDDYSRMKFAIFLQKKSQAFEKLTIWCKRAERQTGQKVKVIQSDKGTEFQNRNMARWADLNGIKLQYSNTYVPSENGMAEQTNGTIFNQLRAILFETKFDLYFCGTTTRRRCLTTYHLSAFGAL